MKSDPEQLASVADITGQVIAAITGEQWGLPTPCAEWNVGDLVRHIVTGNDGIAAALSGEPALSTTAAEPSGDLASAYRLSIRSLVNAFRQPGALQKVVTVPFGIVPGGIAFRLRMTELLVHGWNLARATVRPVAFPEEVAAQELAFSRSALGDIPPGRRPFAPPGPVPNNAPAIDRLAACLGRRATVPPTGPR
jgi:uncharacterized protein (TIGR03086 family)